MPCIKVCSALKSLGLIRGIFDAAMSIYLDRFLNMPVGQAAAAGAGCRPRRPARRLSRTMLNLQQQVNPAGNLVAQYLVSGGSPQKLMAKMGHLLLREDRDFHTIQCVEAAFNQYRLIRPESEDARQPCADRGWPAIWRRTRPPCARNCRPFTIAQAAVPRREPV